MPVSNIAAPILQTCVHRRGDLLRRHITMTWEDLAFGAATLMVFFTHLGDQAFHFYTMLVMVLVLSLAFRRGMAVGMVRMLILSLALYVLRDFKGFPLSLTTVEVAGFAGCGVLAGVLGEFQRETHEALHRSFCQTLEVLAHALECRDPYTEGHSRRTAGYAVAIAQEVGLSNGLVAVIEQAGLLHDLGKMGMPDAILRKNGTLTPEEERQVERHPEEGARILRDIPSLAQAAQLVRHHHEHYDGSGYPDGLVADKIPLAARILTVADVFDALTTDRPYRKASSAEEALSHIRSKVGRLFDPSIVQALERTLQKGTLGYAPLPLQ